MHGMQAVLQTEATVAVILDSKNAKQSTHAATQQHLDDKLLRVHAVVKTTYG